MSQSTAIAAEVLRKSQLFIDYSRMAVRLWPQLVGVTFFKDHRAKIFRTDLITCSELRDLILRTDADTKDKLPWLKLAKYGDRASDKGSLRHDSNVDWITGVEIDYDEGRVKFEDAADAIRRANLSAIVYTSPSHRRDAPRWRVLLFTSKDLPPGDRSRLAARANGVLGGIAAPESFTLSQAFYYGSVGNNFEHRVVLIEGDDFIDERADLDAGAIWKSAKADEPANVFTSLGDAYGTKAPIDVEKRLAAMRHKGDGDTAIHTTQLSVTASLLSRGTPEDEVVEKVLDATRRAGAEAEAGEEGWDWDAEERAIRRMCRDWLKKHPPAEAVIADDTAEPVDLWASFEPPQLPTGVLPDLIEKWARIEGRMMGADPAGLAMAALTVCAAAIPDSIKLQIKRHADWAELARLWTAVIGAPSTMKTPLINRAAWPMTNIDRVLFQRYAQDKAAYDALPNDERRQATPPRQERARIEDTTIEAAQEVLKDSPEGVLCLQDELSGWFGSMDKYSGNRGGMKDRGFWLQSWNGGQYILNRVGRGAVFIENLSVSILGGIQPEPMRRVVEDAHDDGLIQRCCPVVLRPATMGLDEPTDPVNRDYGELVEQLRQMKPPVPGSDGNYFLTAPVLRFDEPAQDIRFDLERKHLELQN